MGSEDGEHIFGTFRYRSRQTSDGHANVVLLNGAKDAEGTYWPRVVAEVATDLKSSWQIIGKPPIPKTEAVLKVASGSKSESLSVSLDIFRPMIGKMKFGKIVLETGESAIFALDELSPVKQKAERVSP